MLQGNFHDSARTLVCDQLEVKCVAANHRSQRDQDVISAARSQALRQQRNLEAARNGETLNVLIGDTGGEQRRRTSL